MPKPLTAAELAARWSPERIVETMRTEHNVHWAPPPVEATHNEEVAAIQEYVADAQAQTPAADEWVMMDPATGKPRPLTPDELFDFTENVRKTNPQEDFLEGLPREHPTAGQTDAVVSAMKDHGVPAESRAQHRWEARMNPEQSRAQALAVATHHPSALRPIRPTQ